MPERERERSDNVYARVPQRPRMVARTPERSGIAANNVTRANPKNLGWVGGAPSNSQTLAYCTHGPQKIPETNERKTTSQLSHQHAAWEKKRRKTTKHQRTNRQQTAEQTQRHKKKIDKPTNKQTKNPTNHQSGKTNKTQTKIWGEHLSKTYVKH